MTLLYRMTADQSDTGKRTLWTTDPDSAKFLAKWEATPARPTESSRLYEADVDLTSEGWRDITTQLGMLRPDFTPRDLLKLVENLVQRTGCSWIQLRCDDGHTHWHGAELYLGDEPVPIVPVPRGED